MPGIFDYLEWRGDISMKAVPFSDADKLILAELSYIDLGANEPTPLADLCVEALRRHTIIEDSGSAHSLLHHKEDERLMLELAKSPRFADVKVGYCEARYDKEAEEQFAAMTVFLPTGATVVVFRGTDWTLVGWKEDFNMVFADVLPAQMSAVEYLTRIGRMIDGEIYVTGHSKGGNLAVYASAFCPIDVSRRIVDITSLDGPGFCEHIISSPEYERIKDRVSTYMPSASIVGALLSHIGKFTLVESRSRAFAQHIPYTWEIMRGDFVVAAVRDSTSQLVELAINDWISSLTPDERKKFIDTVWTVFADTSVEELGDLIAGKNTRAIINNYNSMDPESREYIKSILTRLRNSAKTSLLELSAEAKNKKAAPVQPEKNSSF